MQKIGILGSGVVAQTLGNGFIKYGYSVMLSSRDQSKLGDWKARAGNNAFVGSFEDAAKFGDIIVLAGKGDAALDILAAAGANNLQGKTVIDTTNPIAAVPPQDGVIRFFTAANESLMESLQQKHPEANFVKAFNSVGNALMVDPVLEEGKPTMFICGNSDEAKKQVTQILEQFHWEVEDMGKATAAGPIESLCILWCIPGFLQNRWRHAFKLLKA